MVLAFSVIAFAGVDVSKLQLPGDITQVQANTIIKGTFAKAKEQGVPMNIAVVDAGNRPMRLPPFFSLPFLTNGADR